MSLTPILKLSKKNNISGGEDKLLNSAKQLVSKNFIPITEKKILPPSGDKHDYFSTAVYYWQNPKTIDGLPWVYRDGEYNGEALKNTDHSNYYSTMEGIRDLSLAFKLTGDEKFAQKAISIIDMWFINDSTKMNPHLNYAQGIPGVSEGYASGIIDSRAILWIINSIPILGQSEFWSKEKNDKFQDWCSNFLDWLITSEFGIKESKSKNNHGTFYDLQVATFASFVGKHELAVNVLENVKYKRIEIQIKPDGSMPEELKRTRAFMYSTFNLSAFLHLAILAQQYDINLWDFKNNRCGSIKDALDFVLDNAILNDNWEYQGTINVPRINGLLRLATEYFDSSYEKIEDEIAQKEKSVKIADMYYVY